MPRNTFFASAGAAVVLAAAASSPAFAAGFMIQEQSARAAGRAYSGEAADGGAASLWWNPAAAAAGPGRADGYVGAHYIGVSGEVRDAGSTIQRPVPGLPVQPVGGVGVQEDPVRSGVVPNLAGAWRLNDQWAVGLAVDAPFNFTTRYPLNSWTRYQALKSSLFNVDIQPTLAWKPIPQLTLGAGFDASFVRATLTNALPNPSPLLPDAGSVLHGKGWDYGWVVGLQYRPDETISVGLSYRSRINHSLDGQATVQGLLGPAAAANFSAPATAKFRTPAVATAAVRWRATPALTLNAQVQFNDWSAFDAIRASFAGRTQVTAQDYRDTTSVAVGADYDVSSKLTVRGGVQRDPTPTPDTGRTARVPDGSRWLFAGGATVKPTDRVAIDLAAIYLSFDNSRIVSDATAFAGTPLNTPISMLGSVSAHSWVLSAGLRFNY